MFKNAKLAVSLALALCLAFLAITPTFADISDFMGSNPSTAWLWPGEGSYSYGARGNPVEQNWVPGQPYDIYHGNCGAHVWSATTWGSATLVNVEKTGNFAFAHDPCELTFVNTAEQSVSNFGSPITYYFNLRMELYNKYQNEKVGMFVNDGTGWRPCNTVLVGVDLENNDYGRLACTVTSVGRFAIGYLK